MRHCSCVLGAFSSFPHVALTIFETSAQSLLRKLLRSKAWNLSLFWIRVSHWVMTLNICCFPLLPDNNKNPVLQNLEQSMKKHKRALKNSSAKFSVSSAPFYNSLQNFRTRTNPNIGRENPPLFSLFSSLLFSAPLQESKTSFLYNDSQSSATTDYNCCCCSSHMKSILTDDILIVCLLTIEPKKKPQRRRKTKTKTKTSPLLLLLLLLFVLFIPESSDQDRGCGFAPLGGRFSAQDRLIMRALDLAQHRLLLELRIVVKLQLLLLLVAF